jgi:hypothetical protein
MARTSNREDAMRGSWFVGAVALTALGAPALSGEADVVDVKARKSSDGSYSFDVTVRHADTGWKHYANKWEVLSPDGKTVLGTRTLYHPHEDEQPFTRSLSGVRIPGQYKEELVRAGDSVHSVGGKTKRVKIEH